MVSEKQLIANRLNAQKSTGPRSVEGKLVVSQNATKHGLRSVDVLMPDEDPQPLELLREQLERDLGPRGPMEKLLLERIIASAWRLRRAAIIEQGIFERMPNDQRDMQRSYAELLQQRFVSACQSADALGKLARYENAIDRGLTRALKELRRLQATRLGDKDDDLGETTAMRKKMAEQSHLGKPEIRNQNDE